MITLDQVSDVWPKKPLKDVVDFLDNLRVPVKSTERIPGEYPYYGANGQQGTIDNFIFDEPLILLAEDGGNFDHNDRTIAYRIRGKTWVNNHAHVLRPKKLVDLDFLYYFLAYFDVRNFLSGTTRQKLTKGAAEIISIPLPHPKEQAKIVEILDQADALRQQRATADQHAARLLPTLFRHYFGDLQSNPKNWTEGTLEDALEESFYGMSLSASTEPKGTPILRMNNIAITGHLDLKDLKYVELSEKELASNLLRDGDILFNRTNTAGLVGKTGLWRDLFPAVAASYLIVVRVNRSKAEPSFIWALMNTPGFKSLLAAKGRRAIGMANINSTELRSFPIFLPPPFIQKQFSERLDSINELRTKAKTSTAQIETLFHVLLQRAFDGRLTAAWRIAHAQELMREMELQNRN